MNQLSTPSTTQMDLIRREIQRDPDLRSDHTRRGYLADLETFETWRAGRPATKTLVETYAAELLGQGVAGSTVNRKLAAIRWWSRRLIDLAFDEFDLAETDRARIVNQATRVAQVKDVKVARQADGEGAAATEPTGRHLEAGELAALMAACAADSTPAGARDAALIALAWSTGLRRDELASLEYADLRVKGPDEADLMVRKGKGNTNRTAFLFNGALQAVHDWLQVRGTWAGPLFCAINKGGRLVEQGLSGEAMRKTLDKRAAQAKAPEMTWHDFRRTFCGNLLDSGIDLVTVQKLMGHANSNTTSRYDRRGEQKRRSAVRTSLFVPYSRRVQNPGR